MGTLEIVGKVDEYVVKGLWGRLLISFAAVLCGCASEPTPPNPLEALFKFGSSETVIRFGPIRVTAPRSAQRDSLYRSAFNINGSADRLNQLKAMVAQGSGLEPRDFREIDIGSVPELWKRKLQVAANSSIISVADIEDERIRSILLLLSDSDSLPPPILHVDLRSNTSRLNRSAIALWIAFIRKTPTLENSCHINEVSIRCSELLEREMRDVKEEDIKEIVSDINKALSEDDFRKGVDLFLDFFQFKNEWRRSLNERGRIVFGVDDETFSPQIDNAGNLYLPLPLVRRISEADLDLILSHEAAHVIGLEFDQFLAAVMYVETYFRERGEPGGSMKRAMRAVRAPDEMLVDSIAFAYFQVSSDGIKRYAELLAEVESDTKERRLGALALGELRERGVDLRRIVLRRMHARLSECGTLTINLARPEIQNVGEIRRFEIEYRKQLSDYLAKWGIVQAISLADDEHEIDTERAIDAIVKQFSESNCAQISLAKPGGWSGIVFSTYPIGTRQ